MIKKDVYLDPPATIIKFGTGDINHSCSTQLRTKEGEEIRLTFYSPHELVSLINRLEGLIKIAKNDDIWPEVFEKFKNKESC